MGTRRCGATSRRTGSLAVMALIACVANSSRAAEYDIGVIQVQLNPGHTISEINAAYSTVTMDSLPPLYLLRVPAGQTDENLILAMQEDPSGAFGCAEHAWKIETPEGTRQMVVAAVGGTIAGYLGQDLVEKLHLENAHAMVTGQDIVVAVLDTGVDADHEAISSAILPDGYDFVDDDQDPADLANGVDDDADNLPDEAAGHGTLVAGVIHLMAPDARILPVRVLDDEGNGTTFTVAKGIRYAVEQGADIINLSLGLTAHSGIIAHELALASLASVAMVSAAGNLGVDTVQYYPASDIKVLMVAALDSLDVKAPFSNYHPKVAVSAPGTGIYGPFYDGRYAVGAGTSFAAPVISGECALLLSLEPGLTSDQLYARVTEGVVDIYSIPENLPYLNKLGTGRFDALRMLLTSPRVTEVTSTIEQRAWLCVAPNPVSAGSRADVTRAPGYRAEPVTLFMHDAGGRRVRQLDIDATGELSFDARDEAGRPLPAGAYFIRVVQRSGSGVIRLVVIR